MNGLSLKAAVAAALAGLIGCAVALAIDPHALLVSYLATFVAVSAIPIGALMVLAMTYLVPGDWTVRLHPPLSAATLTLPVAAVLFVPVLIGMSWIYPWVTQPAGEPGSLKAIWLTPWFFVVRSVLYFVLWTALAAWLYRVWGDIPRMRRAASAGLIVYALTASWAGIDWLESLTPEFHSSIYGLLVLTLQVTSGFAFALFVVTMIEPQHPRLAGYGAILLSTILLWGYNHAMQYIILWAGNIPEEIEWYVRRSEDGWGVVLFVLMMLQFVLPFFALLSSRMRGGRVPLLCLTSVTLAMRAVESFWLALPGADVHGLVMLLAVPATLALVGAVWALAFLWIADQLTRAADHRFTTASPAAT